MGALLSRLCSRDLLHRRAFDRISCRHEVEQQHAHAVDVAGNRRRRAVEQLRSQVQRRTGGGPRSGPLGAKLAGPEVHEHNASAAFAHDVVRLDVAVHQSRLVHRRDGAAHVDADDRRLPWIQRAARPDDARQREALDELHPQANDAVVPIDAVDGDHVRVPDARQQPSFLDDLSGTRGSAQQFQGDVSLQRVVPGEIHGAEVALADRAAKHQRPPLGQGVVPRFSGHVGRRRRRVAMHPGQGGNHPQFADEPLHVGVGGRRLRGGPVRAARVDDGASQLNQQRIIIRHVQRSRRL